MFSDSHSLLMIPGWMVREFAGKKVSIHVTYAITELDAESSIGVPFNGVVMDVPQNGRCIEVPEMGIVCQYALADPGWASPTRHPRKACKHPATAVVRTWLRPTGLAMRSTPSETSEISPVSSLSPSFSTKIVDPKRPHVYVRCPGAPYTFTRYHVSRRRADGGHAVTPGSANVCANSLRHAAASGFR